MNHHCFLSSLELCRLQTGGGVTEDMKASIKIQDGVKTITIANKKYSIFKSELQQEYVVDPDTGNVAVVILYHPSYEDSSNHFHLAPVFVKFVIEHSQASSYESYDYKMISFVNVAEQFENLANETVEEFSDFSNLGNGDNVYVHFYPPGTILRSERGGKLGVYNPESKIIGELVVPSSPVKIIQDYQQQLREQYLQNLTTFYANVGKNIVEKRSDPLLVPDVQITFVHGSNQLTYNMHSHIIMMLPYFETMFNKKQSFKEGVERKAIIDTSDLIPSEYFEEVIKNFVQFLYTGKFDKALTLLINDMLQYFGYPINIRPKLVEMGVY